MDQKLKQRLVGLAVIFSLAVIFVPMLLDGPEPEMETLEVKIPPSPELAPLPVRVEEKVIELRRQTDDIEPLQARIVDEDSEPPAAVETPAEAEAKAVPADAEAERKADRKGDEKAAEADAKTGPAVTASAAAAAKPEAGPEIGQETGKATTASGNGAATATVKPAGRSKPVASKPQAEARALPKKPVRAVGGDSFIVQLGSFTDRNKAYALRDRVRKLKLAAVFIEKFRARGTTFYRVRVGPFISRDKARVVLNKLRAKYNIKGQVMTYGS